MLKDIAIGVFAVGILIALGGCKPEKPAGARGGRVEFADSTNARQLFAVKSGIIRMDVDAQRGTVTSQGRTVMYFDDYGARQSTRYTDVSGGGVGDGVQIILDSGVVNYNPRSRSGMIFPGKMDVNAQANIIVRALYMVDSLRKQLHLVQLEDREVLGRQCKGYGMNTGAGVKYNTWLWKKIPMYTEDVSGDGKVVTTVTSLQTDVPLPSDAFTVPPDVRLTNPAAPPAPSVKSK